MAVRFIQPVDTPYESQFIDMPLEFMQQNLETKQKGLDTARTQLGTSEFAIEAAPWHEETGMAQAYRDKFSTSIANLEEELEKNKGSYGRVTGQLGALNREFMTDPELNRIRKHYKLYEANVAPYLGKPNAASLYFADLMKQDPVTGQWGWKDPSEISEADIKTPIEDKVEETVSTELLSYLKPSIKKIYGEGSYSYDEKGKLIWLTPDGKKITNLNLDNTFTQEAIDEYTNRVLQGDKDQYRYIKEFLGLNSFEDIKNLVTGVASKGFYRNEEDIPGKATNVPGGGSRGGEGGEDEYYADVAKVELGGDFVGQDFSEMLTTAQDTRLKAAQTLYKDLSTVIGHSLQISGYAPAFKVAVEGTLEQTSDEILGQKLQSIGNSNPALAQKLVTAISNPSTFATMMMTNPYNYFKEGGRLEEEYGFTREEVSQLEDEMLSTLVGIKSDPNIEEGDLDVVNGILSNYSTLKQASERAEQLEAIFTEAAKQSGLDDETVKESFRILDLIETVTGGLEQKDIVGLDNVILNLKPFSFSEEAIQKSKELQELKELGVLQEVGNGNWKFVKQEYSTFFDDYSIAPQLEQIVNTTSDFNQAVEKLQSESERQRIAVTENLSYGSQKRGPLGTYLGNLEERYKKDRNLLEIALQKAAGGDGKNLQNKSLPDMLSEKGLSADAEVTAVYVNVNSSGEPTNLITMTDEEGNTATFETLIDRNSPELRNIIIQMSKDNEAEVRDASYLLRTNLMFDKTDLGLIDIAFDNMFSRGKENAEEVEVPIKDTRGYTYNFTRTAQATIKVNVTAPNGEVIEVSSIRNAQGKVLDPTNIKNADDARTYLGYLGTLLAGGQGGSSSSVGKQRPQAGDRR